VHPAAVAGADVRHQGRGGRGRLLAGGADGGLQPAPDGRHPRHHRGAQPDCGRDRCAHAARVSGGCADHVRPAVPEGQGGQAQLLADDAAPAGQAGDCQDRSGGADAGGAGALCGVGHRPGDDHVEPRDRHFGPLPAPDRGGAGAGGEGAHARDGLRHHGGVRADGDPGADDRPGGPARSDRAGGDRDQHSGRGGERRGPGRGGCGDGAAEGCDHAEPDADA